MNHSRKIAALLLLGCLATAAPLSGADFTRSVFWNTSGIGNYETVTNWSYLASTSPVTIGNRLPAANDQVFIQTGGTVNIGSTINTPAFDWFEVGGNLGTYSPYVPTGTGKVSQSGGVVNLKWLGIGYDAGVGSTSTYTMTAGQINKVVPTFTQWNIGYNCIGKLDMSGSAVVNNLTQGEVFFGQQSNGVGILSMAGNSVFNTSHWVSFGREGGQGYASLSGNAVFNVESHLVNLLNDNRKTKNNWTTIGGSFNGIGGIGTAVLSGSSQMNVKTGGFRIGYEKTGSTPSLGQLIVNDTATVRADQAFYVGSDGGNGIVTMNGGTINRKTFYDVDPANFAPAPISEALVIGNLNGATGVWNQLGGSLVNNGRIVLGCSGTGKGTMNLLGGTVEATYLDTYGLPPDDAGIGTLNFNGGALKAKANQGDLIRNNITTNIYSGGAIIDTNSFNVTINKSLNAASGVGLGSFAFTPGTAVFTTPPVVQISGDGTGASAVATLDASGHLSGIVVTNPGTGYTNAAAALIGGNPSNSSASGGGATLNSGIYTGGLTVRGGGNLYLSAANTYTGATVVENGTLSMSNSTSFSSTAFNIASRGTLAGTTFSPISPITVASGGTLSPGNPSIPGLEYGSISTSGLTLNDGAVISIAINAVDGFSSLQVNGNVAGPASGKTVIEFRASPDSLPASASGLIMYSGTWTGSTTVVPAVDSIGTTAVSITGPSSGTVGAAFADVSAVNYWNGSTDDYNAPGNWGGSAPAVPNGTDARALFLGSGSSSINFTANTTLSSLILNNAAGYALTASTGVSLTLDSTIAANAQINDMAGDHTIGANVTLNKTTRISVTDYEPDPINQPGVRAPYVLTLSGVIGGSGSITQQGPGTLVLTNAANTYAGPTVMKYSNSGPNNLPDDDSAGTLVVAALANGGQPSSIGASSSSADNLVLAGTFKYTGADVTTDRGFTIGSYVNFDIAHNVTMTGQVKGVRSGGFIKYGAGTLTLSNTLANVTYDDFRVREGTLVFDGNANTTWKMESGAQYYFANDIKYRGAWLCVGDSETTSNTTMEIRNGAFDINGAVQVGMRMTSGVQATLNMSGGRIDAIYLTLGDSDGSGGYSSKPVLNMSGSANITSHYASYIGEDAGSDATLTMTGSSVLDSNQYILFGYHAGAKATATLDGSSQLTVQTGARDGVNPNAPSASTTDAGDYRGLNIGYDGVANVTVKGNATVTTAAYIPTTVGLQGTAQGILNIQDSATLAIGNLRLGERDNAVGVVKQSGGTISSLNANTQGEYGTGIVSNWAIGGNLKADGVTPWSTTSYGYYGQSGGTISPGVNNFFIVGYTSNGIFDQTGGTLNVDYRFRLGETAGSFGLANVGGTGIVNQRQVWTNTVGVYGYGVLNVSGSGLFNSDYRITLAANAGSTGIVNIGAVGSSGGSGTLRADWLQAGSGTSIVNFHGGTLKANSSQTFASPDPDLGWIGLNSYVYGEGAIFDTNGYSVTISKNLLAPTGKGVQTIALTNGGAGYIAPPMVKISGGSGSGATANAVVDTVTGQVTGFVITNPGTGYGDLDVLSVEFFGGGATTTAAASISATNLANNVNTGGITKNGSGTLTLTAANTYAGPTKVTAGVLSIGSIANGGIASPIGVSTSAAGNLILDGGTLLYTGTDNPTTNRGFTVGPNIGTISTNGNLTFSGSVVQSAANGKLTKAGTGTLTLTGPVNYSGPTLISAGTLAFSGGATSSIGAVTGTGTLSVSGTGTTLTTTSIRVGTLGAAGAASAAVPEPSTLVLLAAASLGILLGIRRRK